MTVNFSFKEFLRLKYDKRKKNRRNEQCKEITEKKQEIEHKMNVNFFSNLKVLESYSKCNSCWHIFTLIYKNWVIHFKDFCRNKRIWMKIGSVF